MSRQNLLLTPPRSYRKGFPPLFLASAIATKTLSEVHFQQPVLANELALTSGRSKENTNTLIRQLVQRGLLRRFTLTERQRQTLDPRFLTINDFLPFTTELKAALQSFGETNGFEALINHSEALELNFPVNEKFDLRADTLFGPYRRTAAIVVVALIDKLDSITITKVTGSTPPASVVLFHRLERDGIFEREHDGKSVLYSLSSASWAAPFATFIRKLTISEPRFASLASTAKTLRTTGFGNHKRHLRKRFSDE